MRFSLTSLTLEPPSPSTLKAFLAVGELSVSKTANRVGVIDRTVKKWRAGDKSINYCAWRVLLIEFGIIDAN